VFRETSIIVIRLPGGAEVGAIVVAYSCFEQLRPEQARDTLGIDYSAKRV